MTLYEAVMIERDSGHTKTIKEYGYSSSDVRLKIGIKNIKWLIVAIYPKPKTL